MGWVEQEKQALVTTLRASDPSAPTLDAGWDVARLLAHLVQREQGPAAMIKDAVAKKPPGQEPNLSELVAETKAPGGFEALIDRFVSGPPAWSPMSFAAEKINLAEYTIHHEDIRRAGENPAEPRTLPKGQTDAIWAQLSLLGRAGLRQSPVGVGLATPDGRHKIGKNGDANGVTITGEPLELALYAGGRRECARVDITGPAESVSTFKAWAASN